jgi:transcriptional antiterminator RfaH
LTEDRVAAVSALTMSFWACARTLPQRESFASERLIAGGFEIFAPKIETKRSVAMLFPSYLFIFVVAQWRTIDCTPGVLKLIRFGDTPAKVPEAEIESLRRRVDAIGVIRLPPPPPPRPRRTVQPGARVRIISGAFQGLAGLYQGQTTRERELVLLRVLGGQRSVAIASAAIEVQ